MKSIDFNQLFRPDLKAHIYSDNLKSNVDNLRSLCVDRTRFCAVVKANAYGHGMAEVVNILRNRSVDFFAVASVYEAAFINPLTDGQSILIFEPINSSMSKRRLELCANEHFHCAISSLQAAKFAADVLKDSCMKLNLHVNVETGMGRLGIEPDKAVELISFIESCENLDLSGVFTHFATADEDDLSFAYQQLETFDSFIKSEKFDKRDDVIVHASNSAATMKLPQAHFDMVRCGISMYGYYSRPQNNPPIRLKPAMKLEAPVVQVKKIPAGESVSYGRSFITERETLSAIIPFGYSDGYFRAFANKAMVRMGDSFAPVMGRICMDQFMVDVTDIDDISVGDMVTIIDNDLNSKASAYALAEIADTICYEILICVHEHVRRVVH